MNHAGSEVPELNKVATTRDAGGDNQLPVVCVAREDCDKACGRDLDWSVRQRRRHAPRDNSPLLPGS